ncbi:hypothetical protein HJ144_12915 [Vibrio parahaemolyticus]|nr:hypothetical protein [Vibrio parahaemolyticus]MBE4424129.1 hypothetical protein [Vibrio parahaemolyticus]HCE3707328.1 hypothetical protein [Vibrio parahaemolyticus]HCG7436916.1 hypothetical protein [Vibrio parahaemolyticus]
MKLRHGEKIPRHCVSLLVYLFNSDSSSEEPVAVLQQYNRYVWTLIKGYGQTHDEAFEKAISSCPDDMKALIRSNANFERESSCRDADERFTSPYYLHFSYTEHLYSADIQLSDYDIRWSLRSSFASEGSVVAKEYYDELKTEYPHKLSQTLLANALMKTNSSDLFLSLIQSVAHVVPTTEELENALAKLPYGLLTDIEEQGFDGYNIDNRILAYLEDLDPSIVGDLLAESSEA